MKGASSAIKYLKVWQKNAEERRNLVDQDSNHTSYIQPPTSPTNTRTTSSVTNLSANEGRKTANINIPTPKNVRKTFTHSYDGHKTIQGNSPNPGTKLGKVATSPQKEKTISTSSTGRTSYTNETYQPDEVFDDPNMRSDFNNPAYNWLYDSNVVSIRSDNHPTSNLQSVSELTRMEFNKLPFATYRCRTCKWTSPILQGFAVTMGMMLIPFVAMVFIFIAFKCRFRPKMTHVEKRRENIGFLVILLVSLFRDLVITVIIVSATYDIPLSTVRIAQPLCLFLWPLLFCFLPAIVAYYADPVYEFGLNPMKKICVQLASHLTFSNVKATALGGKTDMNDRYFSKNYPIISTICGANDECVYLKNVTSRLSVNIGISVAIFLCIMRSIPLFSETSSLIPTSSNHTTSGDKYTTADDKYTTTDDYIKITDEDSYDIHVCFNVLSSLNSFFMFLFFSVWPMYVILWNVAILKEWRHFNANESDDNKTLINKGPQAASLWWKIRETLILYSTSSCSMSVITGKILYATSCVVCMGTSVAMVKLISMDQFQKDSTAVMYVTIDTILIFSLLLVMYVLQQLIRKERAKSTQSLLLKKTNVGYEIGCISNLEQELIDRDPNLRNRLRLLRGRLLLLQEMFSVVGHTDDNETNRLTKFVTFMVGLFVMGSTVYSVHYISINM